MFVFFTSCLRIIFLKNCFNSFLYNGISLIIVECLKKICCATFVKGVQYRGLVIERR